MAIQAFGRMRWLPRSIGALVAAGIGGTMLWYSMLKVLSGPNAADVHWGLVVKPIPSVFGTALVLAAILALAGRRSWAPVYWLSFACLTISFVVLEVWGPTPLITIAVDGFDTLTFPQIQCTVAEGIIMLVKAVALLVSGVLMHRFAWAARSEGSTGLKTHGDGVAS